jgi:methanogenic corrinoid protein MtbC1
VRFGGAAGPVDELGRMVSELAPRLLALSVTLPLHTAMARAAIGRIRATDPLVKILVGGRAIAAPRAAAEALGADAVARTATAAVEVARAWK